VTVILRVVMSVTALRPNERAFARTGKTPRIMAARLPAIHCQKCQDLPMTNLSPAPHQRYQRKLTENVFPAGLNYRFGGW
jgi:hypothetical protein